MFLVFFVWQVLVSSLICQSSLSFINVSHIFERLLFYYQRQGVVSFITLSISVGLFPPLSLIGQSSLSFIAVLHMFEHVLFYYQKKGVVSFITIGNSVWSP